MFKEIIQNIRRKNETVTELEMQDKAATRVAEKKLSANERELNKILETKRQENIKKQLDSYKKKDLNDFWHKDVVKQKFIFKEKGSMMVQPSLLVQRNIFVNQRRLF